MTPKQFIAEAKLRGKSREETLAKYNELKAGGFFDVPASQEVSEPKPLAEKTAGFLRKPSTFLPALPIFSPFIEATKKAGLAGVSAEKNYPAQNLLPPALSIAGGLAGGMATLPSGAGVPFGATMGAGAGGAAGEAWRQNISRMRGQPSPETSGGAATEIGIAGAGMAGAELGGAGILKVGKTLGIGNLAQKGLQKFSGKVGELMTPLNKEAITKLNKQLKDIPAVKYGESKTVKTIKEMFTDRGISTGEKQLTKSQLKNFSDAGLNEADMATLVDELSSTKQSIKRMAKGKAGINLESDLATTPLSKYQELGNTLKDLNKKDLTYSKMGQVQKRIADLANLNKPDIARTPIENLYGIVYHNLGEDMAITAEKSGMKSAHIISKREGQKYFEKKLLEDALEKSMSRTKGVDKIDYGKLFSELNDYSSDELVRKFGDDAKYIKVLRDVAETHADTFGGKIRPRIGISPTGGAYTTVGGGISPIARMRTPTYMNTILERYLGDQGLQKYGNILINDFKRLQNITSGTLKTGIGLGLPSLNK